MHVRIAFSEAEMIGAFQIVCSNTSIMLRQILKASYTVPAFVSPACKLLIQSMMKVNRADRITIEAILEHQWLKLAARVPTNPDFQMPSLAMPAPQAETIKDISQASARTAQSSNGGIFSPFEAGGESAGAMPMLVQWSASLESLVCARAVDENASHAGKCRGRAQPRAGAAEVGDEYRGTAPRAGRPAEGHAADQ
jgi:hypothetical protein